MSQKKYKHKDFYSGLVKKLPMSTKPLLDMIF